MIPDSTIYCCVNVLLRSDQAHTIYFADAAAQRAYFLGKAQLSGGATFTNYTITRDDVAYVDAPLYNAQFWNYAMIEDKVSAGGLFRKFYFIEDATYVDENVTALHLKLDVMQTFQRQPASNGYADVLPYCFVEREHSVYDGSRAFNGTSYNTVEEGIDTGEYVIRDSLNLFNTSNFSIVIAATIRLDLVDSNTTSADIVKIYGQMINGMYSGIGYYAVPVSTAGVLPGLMLILSQAGYIDAIRDIFIYPSDLIELYPKTANDRPFQTLKNNLELDWAITKPTTIGSYTPKNKKVLQYPYCMGYISNYAGLTNTLKFEHWQSATIHCKGSASMDKGILCYPKYYKGITDNKEEGVLFDSLPCISWISDTYELWLAQTSNTRRTNVEIAQAEKSYAYETTAIDYGIDSANALNKLWSLDIAGSLTSSVKATTDMYKSIQRADLTFDNTTKKLSAEKEDRYITPPVSVGNPVGMSAYLNNMCFPLYQLKTIDDMHAKIIDDYFSVYGYQTNAYKVPNISSRPAWNFVKTAGFDAKQNIAQKYKIEISKVFNNGVTFWKNGNNIGNYSLNNDPQT